MSAKSAKRARRIYGFKAESLGMVGGETRAERRRSLRAALKALTTTQPLNVKSPQWHAEMRRQVVAGKAGAR